MLIHYEKSGQETQVDSPKAAQAAKRCRPPLGLSSSQHHSGVDLLPIFSASETMCYFKVVYDRVAHSDIVCSKTHRGSLGQRMCVRFGSKSKVVVSKNISPEYSTPRCPALTHLATFRRVFRDNARRSACAAGYLIGAAGFED
ncbi:hypothetical protein EVAR_67890_1 [Eumeta japonica]|uniref:Uncharacterized protein n=1 Tax=Eumeta variegata TaxID=151549 RepID=A0A4C1YXZ9_EUMVA|nr:hypothetical protein EVAR_67890_1 [Eumeta japonica]